TNTFDVIGGITGVGDRPALTALALGIAGANPSRQASLQFGLPTSGDVQVRVYDVRGALVTEIASGMHAPRWHLINWDGTDASGRAAKPGIYFVRAGWNGQSSSLRFVLLR